MMIMPILTFFQLAIVVFFERTILAKHPEQIHVQRDESFTFDCPADQSIFYAQRLGDWSEISDDNEQSQYLNLKLQHLPSEKLIRVTCSSAQPENTGYYGCRKTGWSTKTMDRIFQLVLADVESFYWTYVCHGPAGSCDRQDDSIDDTRSVFYVADQTKADIFCCASTTGYSHVEIKMNPVGDARTRVNEQRRVDLAGSSVVCAKQHPFFNRANITESTLNCELIVDQRVYGTYHTRIVVKDAMLVDHDVEYEFDESTRSFESKDDSFFDGTGRPFKNGGTKGKISTGKKLAIILGSTFGGVVVLAVILSLCICLCHKKKKVSKKKSDPTDESSQPRKASGDESGYVEATPLYVNAPVFLRL